MHTLRGQLVLFVICSMHSVSLHGMEIVENEYNKNVFEIAAYNVPHEYEAQRVFAALNKKHNNIIEDTYRQDKKRIERVMQEKNNSQRISWNIPDPERISWNKDFSRCTWVEKPTEHYAKYWILVLMGVKNNDVIIKPYAMQTGATPVFYEYPRSYFTQNGQAFCFMYAYVTARTRITYHPTQHREVVQMKYDFSGHRDNLPCFIRMENGGTNSISQMLNYPYCIRAFLASTDVHYMYDAEYGDLKLYYIRGVTVPNCYKAYFRYQPEVNANYSGYDTLPEWLRNTMDDLFFKQQVAKNNDTKK